MKRESIALGTRIYVEQFSHFVVTTTVNCKLVTVENIQGIINSCPDKFLEVLKKELKYEKTFFVHVTDKKYIDFLKESFNIIYCQEVPIGYNGTMQYHALFECECSGYHNRIEKFKQKPKLSFYEKILSCIRIFKER